MIHRKVMNKDQTNDNRVGNRYPVCRMISGPAYPLPHFEIPQKA